MPAKTSKLQPVLSAAGPRPVESVAPARVTVQNELEVLFNELVTTGAEIEAMEETLNPVTHDGGIGAGKEISEQPPQPVVIYSIRVLQDAVRSYNARLSSLRSRLALS